MEVGLAGAPGKAAKMGMGSNRNGMESEIQG